MINCDGLLFVFSKKKSVERVEREREGVYYVLGFSVFFSNNNTHTARLFQMGGFWQYWFVPSNDPKWGQLSQESLESFASSHYLRKDFQPACQALFSQDFDWKKFAIQVQRRGGGPFDQEKVVRILEKAYCQVSRTNSSYRPFVSITRTETYPHHLLSDLMCQLGILSSKFHIPEDGPNDIDLSL